MTSPAHHRLVVTGPESEVRRFREKVIHPCEEDGQDCFDFETLVPMPDSVRNTEARTKTRLGMEIVGDWVRYCFLTPEMERSFLMRHQVRENPMRPWTSRSDAPRRNPPKL